MSFFGDIYGGKAAQAGRNYNAALLDRDAKIKEMEADQAYKVYTTYDLPKFNHQADQIDGTMKTYYATSGAELSGSPIEVLFENSLNMERDRDMLKYNAETARDQKYNDAINARAEASMERFRGKVAKRASYYAAGQSLLSTASMTGLIG
nr:putative internal protein A [uncultured Mediterranean phage uvMED]